jgi:hypothetical protein
MLDHQRLPVTDVGVVVPKSWFGGASEVEVSQISGQIILAPAPGPTREEPKPAAVDPNDPIWSWGTDPIKDDPITDGSVNLDRYLYGFES